MEKWIGQKVTVSIHTKTLQGHNAVEFKGVLADVKDHLILITGQTFYGNSVKDRWYNTLSGTFMHLSLA